MTDKPVFVQNANVSLEKLSLGEQSGWRNASPSRVQELMQLFVAGQFGQGTQSGVQILGIQDVDGGTIIDDGISTVDALMQMKARAWDDKAKNLVIETLQEIATELKALGLGDGTAIRDQQIIDIFQTGLPCKMVIWRFVVSPTS